MRHFDSSPTHGRSSGARLRWRIGAGTFAGVLGALAVGCASTSGTVPRGLSPDQLPVDLARFMGDWYVIAHIPTGPEKNAHEAIERYTLREDGDVDVRFTFCEGAINGPSRLVTMKGWVVDERTGAEWRVRPTWPLRLRYQIAELDPGYTKSVIVHPDSAFTSPYAWIMARSPDMAEQEVSEIIERLAAQGYERQAWRRVPHEDGVCDAGS